MSRMQEWKIFLIYLSNENGNIKEQKKAFRNFHIFIQKHMLKEKDTEQPKLTRRTPIVWEHSLPPFPHAFESADKVWNRKYNQGPC